MNTLLAFLPESVLLLGAAILFAVTLSPAGAAAARRVATAAALLAVLAAVAGFGRDAVLFSGAYRVDAFSQALKLVLTGGFAALVVLSRPLPDVREETRPEYWLFLNLSVTGLVLLVSSVDVITLVVALELSSFPLYVLVALRRERAGQRTQMESAIKYLMFGVAANGVMLFGLSYLYGLTGTTSLPLMAERLAPVMHTPLALAGLALAFAGVYYKLAVFPFHFWTPDVYQGAANETAALIASLPKLGAVAVLVRFASLATPDQPAVALMLSGLAIASMLYGNLLALGQRDLKRLLGFSGIAHAGYVLVGFVALDDPGFAAALYYVSGYLAMVLACFVVIARVSRDGENLAISDLAGLHRRSPLLALTLLVALFGLAGLPPFVGFMGKVSLLTAAFARGHVVLVVVTMANAAIAIYYYLRVVREAVFGESAAAEPVTLSAGTRTLCVVLTLVIVLLGVLPGPWMDALAEAVTLLRGAASLAGRG